MAEGPDDRSMKAAALATGIRPSPAMRTFPFGNAVAVWPILATVMLPVAVNVPDVGSYNSALASLVSPLSIHQR